MANPQETTPYVYMGHINMHNVPEAGAELAVHLNRVMSFYHYRPGEPAGIVIKGNFQDDKYKERMAKLGVIVSDDGTVLSRDPNRSQFKASCNPNTRKKGQSQPTPFQPKITPSQRLNRRNCVSQPTGSFNPRTSALQKPEGFIMAIQEFNYVHNCVPNLRGHKLIVNQNSKTPRAAIFHSRNMQVWGD